MLGFARIYFLIFGLATIAGGVSGYVIAGSKPSIIAGGVAGLLLILGGVLLSRVGGAYMGGLALSLLVSLALAGRFIPALVSGKLNPAAYMVPLSVVGVCAAAVLLFRPER